jgi:hypothetical protein
MQTIHRVNEPALDQRGPDGRAYVRFRLSRPPDHAWIAVFKAHAASSALGATNAVFAEADVSIEVAKARSVPEVATALDCFIECANLRLRSIPQRATEAERKPPALSPRRAVFSPVRPRPWVGRGPDGTHVSDR